MPLINTHANISCLARGKKFGLSLHLYHVFVYVISEGSGKTAHVGILAWDFAAVWHSKYQNFMHWLNASGWQALKIVQYPPPSPQ